MDDNQIFLGINEVEVVSINDCIKAYEILYHFMIKNEYDIYLFCAAINLLNTFVKQNKKRISYSFKSRVFFLVKILIENDFENVFVDYKRSKAESLLLIQVLGVQFSFHGIIFKDDSWHLLQKYARQISWDGIRKQKCAVTAFSIALNNPNRTNETREFKDMNLFIDEVLKKYENNEIELGPNGPIDHNGYFI